MIRVPGDKSISHRALLLSALSTGRSRLSGLLPGADCRATANALRSLGVDIPPLPHDGAPLVVSGLGLAGLRADPGGARLDCGNSGTTARLLLGLLSGCGVEAVLTGDASLRARPMRRVTGPLSRMGASFVEEGEEDRLPIRIRGGVTEAIEYHSPVASAQVKSALLLAGLAAGVPVTVVEPERSRDHTERMLRRCGVTVEEGPAERGWRVHLPAHRESGLRPLDLEVPGDLSSAVFMIALGLMGGVREGGEAAPLRLGGVGVNPTRTGLLPVLERMGAMISMDRGRSDDDPAGEPTADLVVSPGPLSATEVGADEVPFLIDEVPILAVLASRARGRTVIRGAEELRVKESDRIHALVVNLRRLGIEVEEFADGLAVTGAESPVSGTVETFHDHRIAMAFAVLGALPENDIRVADPDLVEVSYPGFWQELAELSGGGAKESMSDPESRPAPRPPVVTLDGPAGSGKSSTARAVAEALGFRHLDTGALYRAVTLALLRSDRDPEDWESVSVSELEGMGLRILPSRDANDSAAAGFRVVLGSGEVVDELRAPDVTDRVARVARIPAVRRWLLSTQRDLGREGGVVVDGRDTGSVVFPGAEVKIFLTASIEERARRRLLQDGREITPEAVRREADRLAERDRQDESRTLAPLRRPDEAIDIDTTGLSFDEQVDRIVTEVRKASSQRPRQT